MPRPTDSIDALFARFTRTGDPEALARVFELAAPVLLRQARRLLGDSPVAEDAVQELFLSLLVGCGRYDPTRRCLPFLRGALHRQAMRLLGKESRSTKVTPADPDQILDPSSIAGHSEMRAMVARAIARLPQKHAAVVRLSLEHGLTPTEISGVLGRPVATVRVQLHRGLAQLRRYLPAVLSLTAILAMSRRGRAAPLLRGRPAAFVAAGCALACAAVVLFTTATHPSAASTKIGGAPAGPIAAGSGGSLRSGPPPMRRTVVEARDGLAVRVVDTEGSTVPFVGVRAYPAGGSGDLDCVLAATDVDGVARLTGLDDGAVRVDLDRGWSAECQIVGGTMNRLEARIRPGARAWGRVLDPAGNPVSGAAIAVCQDPRRPTEVQVVARSDDHGRFELTHLRRRSTVGAMLEGHAPTPLQMVEQADQEMTLRFLGAGASVRGVVRGPDGPDGPVPGATVLIGAQPRPNYLVVTRSCVDVFPDVAVRTAVDGAFAVDDLPPGRLEVLVLAHGLAPALAAVEAAPSSAVGVSISMRRGRSLTGRVVDPRGHAVAKAEVLLHGRSQRLHSRTHTASDGSFRFDGVADERCEVGVVAAGCRPTAAEVDVGTRDLVLEVERSRRVRWRLLDCSGCGADPHAWELARGQAARPEDAEILEFDPGGGFVTFPPGSDAGDILVRRRGTKAWSRCDIDDGHDPHRVRIPAAADHLATVCLSLQGFSDAQLQDMRVFASDETGAVQLQVTLAGGVARLSPLPARTWHLHIRGEFGKCPPIFLGSHALPVEGLLLPVALPCFGWLRWSVVRTDGVAVQALDANAVSSAGTNVELPKVSGRIALAAGEWRFSATCRNAASVAGSRFTVEPNRETVVAMRLPVAHVTQVSFELPLQIAARCRIELRREGEIVPGFDQRRNLMLKWGSSCGGLCWAVFPLQVGRHRLRVVGRGVDLSGEFFVSGETMGAPILVDLAGRNDQLSMGLLPR